MRYGLELISAGSALPEQIVTNEDMSRLVDTSDAWIRTRTGIRQRHWCSKETSVTTLAIEAAAQALERSGLSPEQIDCCICGTMTGRYATPSLACLVQKALKLREDIPVLDVNAACTGFLYGAAAAHGFLQTLGGKYALVIGSEQLSRIIDYTDRSTCVLFGDGAGAAIFALKEHAQYTAMLGARGDEKLVAPGPGIREEYLQMDGNAVFRFAVDAISRCLEHILEKSGKNLEEIAWIVCHQANERIIDHCAKKSGADPAKFYKNLAMVGNTGAASIPLTLGEMEENGSLRAGQQLILVGFGGGLTWGGMLITYVGAVQ